MVVISNNTRYLHTLLHTHMQKLIDTYTLNHYDELQAIILFGFLPSFFLYNRSFIPKFLMIFLHICHHFTHTSNPYFSSCCVDMPKTKTTNLPTCHILKSIPCISLHQLDHVSDIRTLTQNHHQHSTFDLCSTSPHANENRSIKPQGICHASYFFCFLPFKR